MQCVIITSDSSHNKAVTLLYVVIKIQFNKKLTFPTKFTIALELIRALMISISPPLAAQCSAVSPYYVNHNNHKIGTRNYST